MATSSSYYLNAPSLGSATAVFTNADLTVLAADGFYSDGTIVREQVDGILLPQQTCPSCATPCGETINASGGQGIYLLDLETGTTVSDVGAVIVRFDPYGVPDGIRGTLGSTVYNKLVSPVDGLHQSSNAGALTYIGQTGADCGISGTTYPALTEFSYNGTTFVATGNTQSVTVAPGDVSLGVSAPGSTMMVIPKLTPSPSIINFEVVGPCSGTAWQMSVACPVLLTGFSSSVSAVSSVAACALSETTTYYNASLANTPGTVGLYDLVFADAYGQTPLAAGYYRASGSITGSNDWFQVSSAGVVITLGVCTPPPASVWYRIINCDDSSVSYSQEYVQGDFQVDERVTADGITWVVAEELFTQPTGFLYSITTTGLTGCPTPPPAVSYNCVSGNCVDPGDGTGTYSTLLACQAVCSAPPTSATLNWSYNESGGAISAMDIYVNGSIVESRSATSSGTYTVYEGDTINVEVNVTGCSNFANAYCTGIIIADSCDPSVTNLVTSIYTVTNADLGTLLNLSINGACSTACV